MSKKGAASAPISFPKAERAALVGRVQDYFARELDTEIGGIPAELLIDFFADDLGAYYYNRGLNDAQAVFRRKLDDIDDELYGLQRREARVDPADRRR